MKKIIISKWANKPYQQVVYLTPDGKNKNGKQKFSSETKHESVNTK